MINELDLFWVPNFIALRMYFIFGTRFSWNEGIDTCFNVEFVLLGRNFDFLGGYLVVTARYLVVTAGYCSLRGCYWWLLLGACGYCSFPRLVWKFRHTVLFLYQINYSIIDFKKINNLSFSMQKLLFTMM